GISRVTVLGELLGGKRLEQTAHIAAVGRAVLVDDFTEHQNLARAENVRRRVVKRTPVQAETKLAFALRGEAADRRTVKRQVVVALDQELLVIVEHMQAAFQ